MSCVCVVYELCEVVSSSVELSEVVSSSVELC